MCGKRGLRVTRAPAVNQGSWWDSYGAKHSPPGDKFQKSRHPRARGPRPSEIQISKVKLYPNEEFSTATLMIFNVDSNCVHPRFWIRPQMPSIRTILSKSWKSWENRLLEIKFYEVSWSQMSSLVTPNIIGSFYACLGSFSRSLISDDFLWILVFLGEESASHTLSSAGWVPQVMIFDVDSNCVHPRFWIAPQMVKTCHDLVRSILLQGDII